ncbi:phage tail terminator protein [Thauera butanivorans]|uniref:phage tail terminator protein n=1 Tax=Thauera butanivorans TaxID=86174 RepID=UPI00083833A3|nr:hypothetical protein [Thauera butanivorans]
MTTLLDDWLAPGDRIVTRLVEQVPALRMVETMSTLAADAIEQRIKAQAPAAIVVYMGDRIAPDPRAPRVSAGAQRWCVVLAVRNARAGGNNAALSGEAGPLLPLIRHALAGWMPLDDGRPLRPTAGMAPGFGVAFGYYPQMFELDFVTVPR